MAFTSLTDRPAPPSGGNEVRHLSAGSLLPVAGVVVRFTVAQEASNIIAVTIMSFFIRFYSVENKPIVATGPISFVSV
jgi:hypothetical protein